jgi:hypothetical protein
VVKWPKLCIGCGADVGTKVAIHDDDGFQIGEMDVFLAPKDFGDDVIIDICQYCEKSAIHEQKHLFYSRVIGALVAFVVFIIVSLILESIQYLRLSSLPLPLWWFLLSLVVIPYYLAYSINRYRNREPAESYFDITATVERTTFVFRSWKYFEMFAQANPSCRVVHNKHFRIRKYAPESLYVCSTGICCLALPSCFFLLVFSVVFIVAMIVAPSLPEFLFSLCYFMGIGAIFASFFGSVIISQLVFKRRRRTLLYDYH